MPKLPYWLSAGLLAGALFVQSLGLPIRASASQVASAASDRPGSTVTATVNSLLTAPRRAPDRAPERASGTVLRIASPRAVETAPSQGPATSAVGQVSAQESAPPAEVVQPAPRKGKLVFIDPGHGGHDSGAVHTTAAGEVDLKEKDVNLAIALKLADMLRKDGYDVRMDRTADTTPMPNGSEGADLQARVDLANQSGADVLISIHSNGLDDRSVRGTEVWYCGDRPFADKDKQLAMAIQAALVRNLRQAGYDTVDRGIKDERVMGHFAMTGPHIARPSRMPGVTGEPLFITNDQDAAQLKRPEVQDAIARGYFEGIKAYFGDTQ